MPNRPIGPPQAWIGRDLAGRSDWLAGFPDQAIEAIARSARSIAHAPERWPTLTPADVPLPELAELLSSTVDTLLHGRGFMVLRGLPVDRWSRAESAAAFWILGLHLGKPVAQNARGHLLGHVTDVGLHADDPSVRIYQTNERQMFHTDSADVVGLLCLQTARRGGLSALASTAAVHDILLERHPDLLRVLFEPIATDHRGEAPAGAQPFFTIPVLSWFRGHLLGCYQRRYIESATRFPGAPRLDARRVAALDALDAVLEDSEVHLKMELQPGDIQLIHNHALLHDRTAFEDWPEPDRRRHLLRLWLSPAAGWPLPPIFTTRLGEGPPGARGGIQVDPATLHTPLGPCEGPVPSPPRPG